MNKNNFLKKAKNLILFAAMFILILSVTVLISGGCANKNTIFTEKNNGDNLNIKTGDTISIKLESNITTGFKWDLSQETNLSVISLVSSEYSEKESKENLVGGGGFETFNFKALSPGSTIITLNYIRPWEKNVPPEKTFELNITVK